MEWKRALLRRSKIEGIEGFGGLGNVGFCLLFGNWTRDLDARCGRGAC